MVKLIRYMLSDWNVNPLTKMMTNKAQSLFYVYQIGCRFIAIEIEVPNFFFPYILSLLIPAKCLLFYLTNLWRFIEVSNQRFWPQQLIWNTFGYLHHYYSTNDYKFVICTCHFHQYSSQLKFQIIFFFHLFQMRNHI